MTNSPTSGRGSRTGTETTRMPHRSLEAVRHSRKMRFQLILAAVLAIFGIVLFIASFVVPPTGIIDSSVLVAAGEVFTFSGSLIGIDLNAKLKYMQHSQSMRAPNEEYSPQF